MCTIYLNISVKMDRDRVTEMTRSRYNYCELDIVYFDGSEGLPAMGSEQVAISLFELDFFSKKLTRGILVEGSSIVPFTWWLNARANTGDYAVCDPPCALRPPLYSCICLERCR
jgi:hypothetical protein